MQLATILETSTDPLSLPTIVYPTAIEWWLSLFRGQGPLGAFFDLLQPVGNAPQARRPDTIRLRPNAASQGWRKETRRRSVWRLVFCLSHGRRYPHRRGPFRSQMQDLLPCGPHPGFRDLGPWSENTHLQLRGSHRQ